MTCIVSCCIKFMNLKRHLLSPTAYAQHLDSNSHTDRGSCSTTWKNMRHVLSSLKDDTKELFCIFYKIELDTKPLDNLLLLSIVDLEYNMVGIPWRNHLFSQPVQSYLGWSDKSPRVIHQGIFQHTIFQKMEYMTRLCSRFHDKLDRLTFWRDLV